MNRTLALPLLGLGAILALSACGEGDTALSPERLAGSWRYIVNDSTQVYSFTRDGNFTYERTGPSPLRLDGTFSAAEDTLRLEQRNSEGARSVLSVTSYVTRDERALYLAALVPQGRHEGPVGTWYSMYKTETYYPSGELAASQTQELRLVVKADGTVTGYLASAEPPELEGGTWDVLPDGRYQFTFVRQTPTPDTLNFVFSFVDEGALVQAGFDRI